jgi:hypothetical protein
LRDLRGGFAGGEDDFRHAGAERAVVVKLGEAEVFEREIAKTVEGLGDLGATLTNIVEQRLDA